MTAPSWARYSAALKELSLGEWGWEKGKRVWEWGWPQSTQTRNLWGEERKEVWKAQRETVTEEKDYEQGESGFQEWIGIVT